MKLLFLGDVVGKGGREAVKRLLPELRRRFNAQFAVVNGENSAAGAGITGGCARELAAVADVITTGDHVWDQKGFEQEIAMFPTCCARRIFRSSSPAAAGASFKIPRAAKSR